jgi:hypothetical protein
MLAQVKREYRYCKFLVGNISPGRRHAFARNSQLLTVEKRYATTIEGPLIARER